MKRKTGRSRLIILMILSVEALLIVFILCYIQLRPKVVKAVTIEAGSHMVDVSEFLKGYNSQGSFLTDMNSIDLSTPGIYDVQIKIGGKVLNSSLKVIDTVPPAAKTVNQVVAKDDEIKADAFVTDINDSTHVTVSYKQTPDFSKIGDQEVGLFLKDSGNNQTELEARLTVLDIKRNVTIEAGSKMNITEKDFTENSDYNISFETDPESLDISKPGTYEVQLNVDGNKVKAYIKVVDSVPPKSIVGNKVIWLGETPEADSFITDMAGETTVTASYQETPDFTKTGDQKVIIVLEDESGNKTEQSALLTVKKDSEPPVITGVTDKTVYLGETVSYKKGVSVTDNKDEKVDLKIDNSKVNLKKTGSYEVIYSATDSSGNTATASAAITVKQSIITLDTLAQMAQKILDEIITEDMTSQEKAYAIYKWTRNHIAYTGSSDKSDWVAEAYRGINNAVGDCFTYFSVSQALLNQAGIDNIGVTRVGGRTHHYWSLVNCGDGWYHFDATPNKDHKETFMMTQAQVDELTEIRGNNYYTYDKTLYPVTPVEK